MSLASQSAIKYLFMSEVKLLESPVVRQFPIELVHNLHFTGNG